MKISKHQTAPAPTMQRVIRPALSLAAFSIQLLGFSMTAAAAPGDIDPDFGTNGAVVFEQTTANTEYWANLLSLPSGQIVVSGVVDTTNVVAKLTSSGSPMPDFGINGQVFLSFGKWGRLNSLASLPDGRILAAGEESYTLNSVNRSRFSVACLLPSGALDNEFGGDGTVAIEIPGSTNAGANCMVVYPDGKILLAGGASGKPVFVRLTSVGYLDTTFSGDGIVTPGIASNTSVIDVVIHPDGKIIAAGIVDNDILVFRLMPDGTLDESFGNQGAVRIDIRGDLDYALGLALRPSGGIILTGSTGWIEMNSLFIALKNDGSLDESFGNGGIVEIDVGRTDQMHDVTLMPDGRILAAGTCATNPANSGTQFALVRLMPNGSLDPYFGVEGIVRIPSAATNAAAYAIARDAAGRILVIGRADFDPSLSPSGVLLRLLGDPDSDGDGIPDSCETGTGIYVSPFDTGTNPNSNDSDGDGLNDGAEVFSHFSNPLLRDTDGDGFLDGYEVQTGKSPTDPEDKPALVAEARTAIEFTFPTAIGKTYRIEASPDMSEWVAIEEGIAGNGGAITRFYTTRNLPKRFLRVEEQTQP